MLGRTHHGRKVIICMITNPRYRSLLDDTNKYANAGVPERFPRIFIFRTPMTQAKIKLHSILNYGSTCKGTARFCIVNSPQLFSCSEVTGKR